VTVTARGACAGYGSGDVLHDIDLHLEPGHVLAVTGASGAGKTTLLSVLAGVVPVSAGEVHHDGRPVRAGEEEQLRQVGMVLQGVGLVAVLTAAENVEVLLQARRVPRREIGERALEALARVGLGDLGDRPVEELSGGQQQRVAVARALVTGSPLLVVDEPTSELDSSTRDLVVRALREEADRGAVVVVATHDPDVTVQCDFELHLVDGRVAPPAG
jgi:putative ABC transport system ATP-binding protein